MAEVRLMLTISVDTWSDEPDWDAASGRLVVSIPGKATHENVWVQDEDVITCKLRWGVDESGHATVMVSPESRKALGKALPKGLSLASLVGVCSAHMQAAINRETERKAIRVCLSEEEKHNSCMRHDECKADLQMGRLCYESRQKKGE